MAAITTMPDREYRAGKGNSQQSPGIQNKPLDSAAGLLLMFSGVYRDASTFRAYVQQRADRLGYKEQAIKEPSSYIPDERAMLERAKAILASPNFHASESSAGFLEKALQKADALERAYAAKAGIAEYNSGSAELKSQDFAYVKSLMRNKVEALKNRAINHNSFIKPSEGISPSSYPPTSQSTSPSSPFPSPHSPPSHSPSPPPPSSHSPLSHSSPPPSSPFPSSTYRLNSSGILGKTDFNESLEFRVEDLHNAQTRKELAGRLSTVGNDGAYSDQGLPYLVKSRILRDYIRQIEAHSVNLARDSPFVDDLRALEALFWLKTESIGKYNSRRIDFSQFLIAYLSKSAPDAYGSIILNLGGQQKYLSLASLHRLGYGHVASEFKESYTQKIPQQPVRGFAIPPQQGNNPGLLVPHSPPANFRPASAASPINRSAYQSTSPQSALKKIWSWLTH